MNSSESDAGCTAWRSSDSHGCTTDLVTESIVRLSDTFHIVTWNGTTASGSGRGGVGATASSIFLLFISICSPRRLVAHSSSDTTCSLLVLVLVLVLLLSVSVVIVALILAIVVSAEAETGGTTWLVMHSHGGSAYLVSEDIECLSNT